MILAASLFLLAEVLAGVMLTYLDLDRIRDWFDRIWKPAVNQDHLRVTLHEKLQSGQHRVVYGIFNQRASTFVDGESVLADEIDPELAAVHEGFPLVVHA